MATPDVKAAVKAILGKRPAYNKLARYYDGDHPQVYLTARLREIFAGVDLNVTQNWCAIVIDACKERINMLGWRVEDKTASAMLEQEWKRLNLQLESDDVHSNALTFGEAFLIVWPNEEDPEQLDAYYNDPRMVHMFYYGDRPRQPRYAAKLYEAEDGTGRLVLYYADHIEEWFTTKKYADIEVNTHWKPLNGDGLVWPVNTFGVIPVFHFRVDRGGRSDLINAIPLQNGANKLLADMLVAAEYGAFKQRYVISDIEVEGQLKSAPGEVWDLPAGDGSGQGTSVGEFSATELTNYLNAMNTLSMSIGIITRTPKHYFFTQGGDPSGESLIAMEAPLNKKAQDRIDRFTPVWRQVAAFILGVRGIIVEDVSAISPAFEQPETVQPKTRAEITKTYIGAGVPLPTALRWEGRDESEIEKMMAEKEEERKQQQATLAQAVLEQQRNFDQGGQNPPERGGAPNAGTK